MVRSDTTASKARRKSRKIGPSAASQASRPRLVIPRCGKNVAVVRAMRKAVGDFVAIMVDYNQSLTPSEAVQRLRALDDEGLTWVEEPTLAHDYAGHALIARAAKTPNVTGVTSMRPERGS